jgi:DNA-directed RNA polymerase specialized sigma24 family protein
MEEYTGLVQQIATEVKRSFPMVERDDIVQELWLWMASNPDKLERWADDGKRGEKFLATALRRRGRAFGVVEKAGIVGYDLDDLYWYSTGQLRELIPLAFDRGMWAESGVAPEEAGGSRQSRPSEGNNKLAILCDVRSSLEAGSEADKLLLWTHFGLGMDEDEHAMTLGITLENLRTRVHRAVVRVQKRLGGPRPEGPYQGTRRAMSNAQAQAITRNQESEE